MSNVLVVVGSDARASSGADHMAELTAAHLALRGHRVALIADTKELPSEATAAITIMTTAEAGACGERLPWVPDVVHAFDLAHAQDVTFAARIAERTDAIFALTPASARTVWSDEAAGRALCARADVVFALTREEAATLIGSGADAERVVSIGQGPNLVGRGDGSGIRKLVGTRTPIVLFLGRRTPAKGCLTLLEAAAWVWQKLPNTVFLFAGPMVDSKVAEAFAAVSDPRIHDLGVIDEKRKGDVLDACDVLCLPSSADVFPLVFVEAWASGKPVVSGDFVGSREVVRDGVDGVVVRTEPTAIAGALIDLLSRRNVRTLMGEAGRARVESELGWNRIAADVEEGYRLADRVSTGN